MMQTNSSPSVGGMFIVPTTTSVVGEPKQANHNKRKLAYVVVYFHPVRYAKKKFNGK